MAHIYKRGNVWWIAYYRDGKLIRHSLRTMRRREASKRKAEVEYAVFCNHSKETVDPGTASSILNDIACFPMAW